MNSFRRLISSLGLALFLVTMTVMRPDGALRAQEDITLTRPIPGPVIPPPYFRTALENGTRSPDGRPGPAYWQVYSEYDIDARLDPVSGLLSGQETIRFHNRSPNTLPVLQLFLHQNLHKAGMARNRAVEITGGIRIERVRVGGEDLLPAPSLQAPGYRDMDGVMTIRLPEPLAPGATAELEMEWSFVVPQNGAGRMGHSNREMYFMAYWFPKIAVYDDL
ncbi:MAG: M1 family metallopeptidase, partial [Longimicrobiales bacterium]